MTALADRTTATTVSVIAILAAAAFLLLVVGVVALWRALRAAGSPGWPALIPVYGSLRLQRAGREATPPTPRAPKLTALVALVLTAAAAVVYFTVPRSDTPTGSFSDSEDAAVTAASTIAANLLSYSRANFDSDWKRGLAGTTGALYSDASKQRANTLKALQYCKCDFSVKVRNVALVGPIDPSGKSRTVGYTVLVNMYAVHSTAPANPIPQNVQLTVVRSKGKWLASDITGLNLNG